MASAGDRDDTGGGSGLLGRLQEGGLEELEKEEVGEVVGADLELEAVFGCAIGAGHAD